MALVLSGSTGITSGNIADGTIAATDLASGAARSNFGSGAVLQVVQTTTIAQVINSSANWTSSGLSLSITPTSSSNKVLAILNVPVQFGNNGGNSWIGVRLTRAGTQITETIVGNNVQYIVQEFKPVSLSFLDSPNTTSSTTYQVDFKEYQMANRYGSTAVCQNAYGTNMATLQLIEIAA